MPAECAFASYRSPGKITHSHNSNISGPRVPTTSRADPPAGPRHSTFPPAIANPSAFRAADADNRSVTDTPNAAAVWHSKLMLGFPDPFSNPARLPLLTPARAANWSIDNPCRFRNAATRRAIASIVCCDIDSFNILTTSFIRYTNTRMTAPFQPRIDAEIWRRYPDYRALSVTACNFTVQTEPRPRIAPTPPLWMDTHLEAWRAAFRSFGANPKKTASSVDSLWKRLQKDGRLPQIDPIVDLYNTLSVRFGAPFGGEDSDHYVGSPRLGIATGSESFDTARDGAPIIDHPDPGEIVWHDDKGITCRRWNWRQCRRTALTPASRNLWFVIDRLAPMPIDELVRAGEELAIGLRELCPGVETTVTLLEPAV